MDYKPSPFIFCRLLIVLTLGFSLILVSLAFPIQETRLAYAANFDLTGACPGGTGNVNTLITTIHNANNETLNPGPDTIILSKNCIYTLTNIGDTITNTFGQTALPAITTTIIISGNGATILRETGSPNFRQFYIGFGGSLVVQNLTLQNGLAQGGDGFECGGGATGMGGAIFNDRGKLSLENVTFLENIAQGGNGSNAPPVGIGGGGGVGSDGISSGGGGPRGGSSGSSGGNGGFGGGGGAGSGNNGGNGGFGGGGGPDPTNAGGQGGFGGGGGCGQTSNGSSGWGGGRADGSGGGGGGFGGAIFNLTGTVRLTNTTFYSNSAQGGSGPSFDGVGTGVGGAIFNLNGDVFIINSTIVSNSVKLGGNGTNPIEPSGGGIFSLGDSDVSSIGGSAADLGDTANLTLINTIIANTLNGATDCVIQANVDPMGSSTGTSTIDGTNNLIENNSGCTLANQKTGDPNLGPLQNNGNGTLIMALLPGSPALNAGDIAACPAFDQRGVSRPQGEGCDIGAYETQFPQLILSKRTNTSTPKPGEMITYTIIVSNTGVVSATNTLISDSLPTGISFIGPITINPPGGTPGQESTLPILVSNLTITANRQISITFPVLVEASLMGNQIITNTAAVTSTEIMAPVSGKVSITTVAIPSITLTKVSNTNLASVGETITYTYRVTNTGNVSLTNLIANDTPLGTISLNKNSLSPGQDTTGVLTYMVIETDLPGPLTNSAVTTGVFQTNEITAAVSIFVKLIGNNLNNQVYLPVILKKG